MSKKPDAPQLWKLKLESWREVRPYNYRQGCFTPDEESNISRQARQAFQAMKIPESDPIWDNVRPRPAAGAASGSADASAPAPEKNGVVVTKKKTKTGESSRKKVSDIAIPAKDESVVAKARNRDTDEGSMAGTPTSATRPSARRLPGSGFKVKTSGTPPGSPLPQDALRV